MTTLQHENRLAASVPRALNKALAGRSRLNDYDDGIRSRRPTAPRRRWGVLVLLALAAGLIFCHGCHRGDHDDEPALFWFKTQPNRDRQGAPPAP